MKTIFPDASVEVIPDVLGNLYHTDGKTCWVETAVTIEGETQRETLAVMDYKNQSIPAENIKSTEFEKSIKRCLVKNLAMFGLGLSLWNGEELSDAVKSKRKEKEDEEDNGKAEMKVLQAKAVMLAKSLVSNGKDSKDVAAIVEELSGKKNPNGITDVETLKSVIKALETEAKGGKA